MGCRSAVSLLVLGLLTSAASAQIPVTDDAFTSSAAPTVNYGTSLGLVVQSPTASGSMSNPAEAAGYTANTYLKFDLPALASNVTSGNLAKANLRLYVDFVVSQGTFDVYLAGGPWAEGTLTASNAPGKVGAPINSAPISITRALKYIDVDITVAVAAWLNGASNNGLVLVPSAGSSIFISFDSKENPLTAHDPQLSVSVNDASSAQLQQETTRATQAENTISSNLSNEVIRAEGVESGLTGALNNETLRASRAEGSLAGGLAAEITNRVNGDAGIQNSLSNYAQLGNANHFTASQSISGDLSANNINASGALTAAGGAVLPALQTATAMQGFPSNPFDIAASVSDGVNTHNETFRWQAVPMNNGTPSFAAQLKLLYGGGTTPSATLFSFNPDGTINFAANQKFTGDGSGLTGVPLQGVPISSATPRDGEVLVYSATTRQWTPAPPPPAAGTTSIGTARMFASAMFPGSLLSPPPRRTYTGAQIIPDNDITVTRITVTTITPIPPTYICPITPTFRLTDGNTGQDLQLGTYVGAGPTTDSGPFSLKFAAGVPISLQLNPTLTNDPRMMLSGDCAPEKTAADANVLVEYKMREASDTNVCAFQPGPTYACNGNLCSPFDFDSDANNCGGCNIVCSQYGTSTQYGPGNICDRGECSIQACDIGFADCDGNAKNGCEVNTQTDAKNCGSCGNVCSSGQICSYGSCTDVVTGSNPPGTFCLQNTDCQSGICIANVCQ